MYIIPERRQKSRSGTGGREPHRITLSGRKSPSSVRGPIAATGQEAVHCLRSGSSSAPPPVSRSPHPAKRQFNNSIRSYSHHPVKKQISDSCQETVQRQRLESRPFLLYMVIHHFHSDEKLLSSEGMAVS